MKTLSRLLIVLNLGLWMPGWGEGLAEGQDSCKHIPYRLSHSCLNTMGSLVKGKGPQGLKMGDGRSIYLSSSIPPTPPEGSECMLGCCLLPVTAGAFIFEEDTTSPEAPEGGEFSLGISYSPGAALAVKILASYPDGAIVSNRSALEIKQQESEVSKVFRNLSSWDGLGFEIGSGENTWCIGNDVPETQKVDDASDTKKTGSNTKAMMLEWFGGTLCSASAWYLLLASAPESEFGEMRLIYASIALMGASPLSATIGVKLTGDLSGQRGSFWKSLLGAYLGQWLPWLFLSDSIPAWIGWPIFVMGPSIGAVIGYNKGDRR